MTHWELFLYVRERLLLSTYCFKSNQLTGPESMLTHWLDRTAETDRLSMEAHIDIHVPRVRFLGERLGTAFPHLFWLWERRSHTYLWSMTKKRSSEILGGKN